MGGCLLGRLSDNWQVQASTDHYRNVFRWYALVRDSVIDGSDGALLKREPVKVSRIEPVHGGPAVKAVAHMRRNIFVACDADEVRHEAVITFAVNRRREAHH